MRRLGMVIAACVVVAACRPSPRFLLIISENGWTLRGQKSPPGRTTDSGGCAFPPGMVLAFRLNEVVPLRLDVQPIPIMGMAGTAYRISGDCQSLDEIGKVDLRMTDDQLAAQYGIAGPTLMEPESTSPLKIIRDFYTAVNNRQIDAAMALVADDGRFWKSSITEAGSVEGKMQIRNHLEALIDTGQVFELRGLRPRMLGATYAYRVLKDGRDVASGRGRTDVSKGRITSDGDAGCSPSGGCAPAILFVGSSMMDLRRGTSAVPSGCQVSRRGRPEAVEIGEDVVVVFRDATLPLAPFTFLRAVHEGDIFRVGALCQLTFLGKAAEGQSDNDLAAAFGIGLQSGDAVDIPAPGVPSAPVVPKTETLPGSVPRAPSGGRSPR